VFHADLFILLHLIIQKYLRFKIFCFKSIILYHISVPL